MEEGERVHVCWGRFRFSLDRARHVGREGSRDLLLAEASSSGCRRGACASRGGLTGRFAVRHAVRVLQELGNTPVFFSVFFASFLFVLFEVYLCPTPAKCTTGYNIKC